MVSLVCVNLKHLLERGDAVKQTLQYGWDAGFRLYDTARYYKTEIALGEGLRELMKSKNVERSTFQVITKLCYIFNKEEVIRDCEDSLKNLQMDYIDILMLHQPGKAILYILAEIPESPTFSGPYLDNDILMEDAYARFGVKPEDVPRDPDSTKESRIQQWLGMQELKKQGKVKHIGVSNFTRKHLDQLIKDPR